MQIASALVWETQGEPRRENVILTDEANHGVNGGLVVFDVDGRRRAARPGDLPEGSVLLVSLDVSEEEMAAIRQSGYPVRRAAQSRDEAIAAAEAELSEVIGRLDAELRRRHPELYDDAGQMRPEEYERLALKRSGGKRLLTRDDILGLGQRGLKTAGCAD